MCLLGFSRYDLQTGLEWEFWWLLFLPFCLLWLLVSSPLCAGLYSAFPHFLPSRASRARVWSQVLQRWSGLCTVATLKVGQIQAQRQGMNCLSYLAGILSGDRFSPLPFLVPQPSRIRRSGSKAGIVSLLSLSLFLGVPHLAPCHALISGPDHSTSALTTLQKLDSSYCCPFSALATALHFCSVADRDIGIVFAPSCVVFLSLNIFLLLMSLKQEGCIQMWTHGYSELKPSRSLLFPKIPASFDPYTATATHTHRITRPAGISW